MPSKLFQPVGFLKHAKTSDASIRRRRNENEKMGLYRCNAYNSSDFLSKRSAILPECPIIWMLFPRLHIQTVAAWAIHWRNKKIVSSFVILWIRHQEELRVGDESNEKRLRSQCLNRFWDAMVLWRWAAMETITKRPIIIFTSTNLWWRCSRSSIIIKLVMFDSISRWGEEDLHCWKNQSNNKHLWLMKQQQGVVVFRVRFLPYHVCTTTREQQFIPNDWWRVSLLS